jgi:hypothetical protein
MATFSQALGIFKIVSDMAATTTMCIHGHRGFPEMSLVSVG